jgi:hypothetical protein
LSLILVQRLCLLRLNPSFSTRNCFRACKIYGALLLSL